MPKISNIEEFIKQAKLVHGERFDYSKSIYVNNSAKLIIVCKKHGEFLQRPSSHILPQGCSKCRFDNLRHSTEDFIKQANIVHDNKFDYTKSNYIGALKKITITCYQHGDFSQTADSHLHKVGCPNCDKSKKSNTEEFIVKANLVHNNEYTYENTIYINAISKVKINCKEHGVFELLPMYHLQKGGCPNCINEKKLTIKTFIEKANIVHGFRYDYSKINNFKSNNKVKIICKKHGLFEQLPHSHLDGRGCQQCHKYTREKFIEAATKIHNNKYCYDNVIYTNTKQQIDIKCKIHGIFKQSPCSHLRGNICPNCKMEKQLKTIQQKFIKQAKLAHGNKYSYENVIYINAKNKVEIICQYHGSFWQAPDKHINQKHNCPKCLSVHSKKEQVWIASFNNPNIKTDHNFHIDKKLYKPDGFDPLTNTCFEFYGDFWHGNPVKFKPEDINDFSKKTFGELYSATLQKEQALKTAGYNLITIWEDDFDKLQQQNDLRNTNEL